MTCYIAIGYWCHEDWVIACGHDKSAVVRDADKYMGTHKAIYNSKGNFENQDSNGPCAEGYWIEEIEESKP